MSEFNLGDRVIGYGQEGSVIGCSLEGDVFHVLWDGETTAIIAGDLRLVDTHDLSIVDEVQQLINILVQTGNDNKRLLSRKVAQLLEGSKGRLSRSDKLQAAAMLLVSAGLASDADPASDDG